MTQTLYKTCKRLFAFLVWQLACAGTIYTASAQTCPAGVAPGFGPNSCLYEYFTSISASGTGVTSSISVGPVTSCTGSYTDLFATQGIIANVGTTVNIAFSRYAAAPYNAYVSVYIDKNNDGQFDSTAELAGPKLAVPMGTASGVYSFTVPGCYITAATNLHMRLMISESAAGAGAPCAGTYGDSYDFYIRIGCTAPGSVSVSPSSSLACPGVGSTLTATSSSPATFSWTPHAGLSDTTGAVVVATPTVNTTYAVTACFGCSTATATATVNMIDNISGFTNICAGSMFFLSDATPGGTWSSLSPVVTVVNPSTGLFTASSTPGTSLVHYTVGGCFASTLVSVIAGAGPITGPPPFPQVCQGSGITVNNASPGVSWTTSTPSIIYVTGGSYTGSVSGITPGTGYVTYFDGSCLVTTDIQVVAPPPAIVGPSSLCVGATASYTDAAGSGTWQSSNSGIASISSSGVVSGISAGTATISYTTSTGICTVTKNITVTAPLSGSSSVCTGQTITLVPTVGGGAWVSTNTYAATVSGSGVVTGAHVGTTIISYTVAGCSGTQAISVLQTPAIIGLSSTICGGGSTISLVAIPGGSGTWYSNNTGVASVNSSGVVRGVYPGTATISYTSSSGCVATKVITVGQPTITGPSSICTGVPTSYFVNTTGGTWALSSTLAYVSPTGVVTAGSNGTTQLQYNTAVPGCGTFKMLTLVATPAIFGGSSICGGTGTTLPLTVSPTGGTWSSSANYIATVSSVGTVTSVGPGSVTIGYTKDGCSTSHAVTVNDPYVSGSSSICVGATTTLATGMWGGTWSSSNYSVASVNASGVVYGISGGTATISYSNALCGSATHVITVGAGPASITGPTHVCGKASGTVVSYALTGSPAGGAWSSSNASIATVLGSGGTGAAVFPVNLASGTVTITYTVSGCSSAAHTMYVVDQPYFVSGGPVFYLYSNTPSTIAIAGGPTTGTWSSGGMVSVTPTGITGGVSNAQAHLPTYGHGYSWIWPDYVYFRITDGTVQCTASWEFYLKY